MTEVEDQLSQLRRRADEQTGGSIHVARLNRALTSRPDLYSQPDLEAVKHFFSRLEVWAQGLAADLERDSIRRQDVVSLLRYLERASTLVASTRESDVQPD